MSEEIKNPSAFAHDNKLEIVEPADNELQLDLDTPEAVERFKSQLKILKQFVDVKRVSYTESKSGNTHAYVVMADPMTVYQRIALQACLGSDVVRELLSFRNVRSDRKLPMFLYEKAA